MRVVETQRGRESIKTILRAKTQVGRLNEGCSLINRKGEVISEGQSVSKAKSPFGRLGVRHLFGCGAFVDSNTIQKAAFTSTTNTTNPIQWEPLRYCIHHVRSYSKLIASGVRDLFFDITAGDRSRGPLDFAPLPPLTNHTCISACPYILCTRNTSQHSASCSDRSCI